MSAAGTPKASEAAIAAVQKALGCRRKVYAAGWGACSEMHGTWTERGCPVAVAAADTAALWIAAAALREWQAAFEHAANSADMSNGPTARTVALVIADAFASRASAIEAGQ